MASQLSPAYQLYQPIRLVTENLSSESDISMETTQCTHALLIKHMYVHIPAYVHYWFEHCH